MHTTFQVTLFLLFTKHLSHGGQSIVKYPQAGELKFAVYLKVGDRVCSGSIIHEEWVVTAAQCLYSGRGRTSSVTVTAGLVDTMAPDENVQERRSSDVIVHRDFKPNQLSMHDIALIKVKQPFLFNNVVGKITVPDYPLHQDDKMICITYGYGGPAKPADYKYGNDTTTTDDPIGKLVQPVFKLRMWTAIPKDGITACPCCKRFQCQRLICSGSSDDEVGLCQADAGGGLVCYQCNSSTANTTSNGQSCKSNPRLYGIAHMAKEKKKTTEKRFCQMWSVSDTLCSDRSTINVFTKVCPLTLWLAKYVPDMPPECDSGRRTSGFESRLLLCFMCFAALIQL